MSLLNYYFIEKQDNKKNLIIYASYNSFKVIFVLLVKIIAI